MNRHLLGHWAYKRDAPPSQREIEARRHRTLCAACAAGNHSENHWKVVGCLATVAEDPRDYVCSCQVTKNRHA
jgi:hypothetical protein